MKNTGNSMKIKSLVMAGILGTAMAAQGAVVVRWSDPGGRDDIITANQGGAEPTTYVDGATISPAVSASYYPNNSGYTPIFNGAASPDEIATATSRRPGRRSA